MYTQRLAGSVATDKFVRSAQFVVAEPANDAARSPDGSCASSVYPSSRRPSSVKDAAWAGLPVRPSDRNVNAAATRKALFVNQYTIISANIVNTKKEPIMWRILCYGDSNTWGYDPLS